MMDLRVFPATFQLNSIYAITREQHELDANFVETKSLISIFWYVIDY